MVYGVPVIHSEIEDKSMANLKKVKEISDEIDKAFEERGYPYIETWAETEEQDRFNRFLGYKYYNIVEFIPEDYPNEVRRYRKEF